MMLEYQQLHKAGIFQKGQNEWLARPSADAVGSKGVTAPFSYFSEGVPQLFEMTVCEK